MQIERLRIVNSTVMVYNIDGDSVALRNPQLDVQNRSLEDRTECVGLL